ncbi:ABC transporter substrate-binding protein [Paenibacillus piri]|uniref:SgrR family transcriptional regulator n=1 Tax=Paenibacillus piri TaxID=2547395 RepID=A0A4R5KHI8_9BACL|nr:ABC transporter substrate-binding protein [Paenibacillus piri]TDF93837.1 hypothetical protein E1757_25990 [Paenibacillus piri]
MQLLEHYARLYSELKQGRPHLQRREEIEVTVSRIAACLFCTERNAKLLIRAMRERGWIAWSPGRGRGNQSRLTLLAEPDELLLEQASVRLADNRIQETVALLDTAWLTAQGRERLLLALQQSFGYVRMAAGAGTQGRQQHIMRFPSYRLPGLLDPAYAMRRTELHFIRQLFDTLIEYDSDRERYAPGLAHHWETDRHAEVWRFYLQKHVRFHHDAPFTAEDVKYTLDRLRSSSCPSPYRELYSGIREVMPIDEHIVDIRLFAGQRHMPALLASTAASIIPHERAHASALESSLPLGTGPFRLTYRDERQLVLESNPFYYRRPAHVDRIEMWYIPEVYEEQFARSGEPDQEGEGMNFKHYGATPEDRQTWELAASTDRGCKYVLLNRAAGGLLEQPGLRRIVSRVIRANDAAKRLGGNRGELADCFINGLSGFAAPEPDAALDPPSESNGAAAPDSPLLRLVTYAGAGHERDADWLRQALEAHRIRLEIRLVPYEQLSDPAVLSQADLLLLEQPVDADAEWTMRAILGSGQCPLRHCLPADRLPELDRRLAELADVPSRETRLRELVRLERELLDQTVILWYRWRQTASFPPQLRDVRISAFGWVDYKRMWFAHDT